MPPTALKKSTLTWTPVQALYAPTNDNGHYRILELPEGGPDQLRFVAVRSRIDDKGRLWEYTVGRFRTPAAAQRECHLDWIGQ